MPFRIHLAPGGMELRAASARTYPAEDGPLTTCHGARRFFGPELVWTCALVRPSMTFSMDQTLR
jgi:hypothetical protein